MAEYPRISKEGAMLALQANAYHASRGMRADPWGDSVLKAHDWTSVERDAQSLRRLYTLACNGAMTNAQVERIARLRKRVEEGVEKLLLPNYTLEHNSDPRGAAVKIAYKGNVYPITFYLGVK